ncbi:complex 1 protein [Colletotrichum cuscutae]|uniref:NADH dehydrogenase [ubiquinone] 1 beta subcomplex subunit 9 n=1 Tax=Colletotrichum cuscutae TaxID=1209917 RepID=A0AAI9UGI4_9PEZI|nr:complex 1 protein [Colletotrichum cuscutae]
MSTRQAALSLYRRSLKLALDWAVHRHLWRGQALYIRSLFEANRSVTDSRQKRVSNALGRSRKSNEQQPLTSAFAGTFGSDREIIVEMEAPRALRASDSTRRYVVVPPRQMTALHAGADDANNDCTGSKFERNLRAPILDPPPPLKF